MFRIALTALALAATAARADDPPKPATEADPAKQAPAAPKIAEAAPADPAYERYLDRELLRKAWRDLDPAAMADAALLLAEGERVLRRPCSDFSAAQVMEFAAQLAGQKGDAKTLERLAGAAKDLKLEALAGKLAATSKLAGASRPADPNEALIKQMTPEEKALFLTFAAKIKSAKVAGLGQGALDGIKKQLGALEGLKPEYSRILLEMLAAEPAAAPAESAGNGTPSKLLAKLAAPSRPGPQQGRVVTETLPDGRQVTRVILDDNTGQVPGSGYYSYRLQAQFRIEQVNIPGRGVFTAAKVLSVDPYSPLAAARLFGPYAQQVRLEPGDVIFRLDNVPVTSNAELDGHILQTTIRFMDINTGRILDGEIFIPDGGGNGGGFPPPGGGDPYP